MSDIVLKIDADTARYIAKIAQMAEATKGVAKPVKEANELWEAGVEIVGRKIMKLTAVGAAVELVKIGAEAVTEQYDHWIERLNEAKKTMESIAQAGKGPLGGSAAGPGADRGALLGMNSQLSIEQRFGAYNAFRQAAPGSTSAQRIEAVRAASDADAAGLGANEFASGIGKLRGLGESAKDVTALALGKGGAQSSAIIDLLAQITAKSGAEQAKNALPLALSAAQQNGGVGLLSQAYSAFSSQGRQGSFADTFRTMGQSLVPGIGDQATLRAINGGARPVQTSGQFQAMVGAAEGDLVNQADTTTRSYATRKQIREYTENIGDSLHRQADETFKEYYGKKGLFKTPFINSALRAAHFYDSSSDEGTADAAKTANNLDDLGRRFTEAIEKQTSDQRAPAIGTQGEGGP